MAIPGLKRPGLSKVVMEVGIRGQDQVPAQRCRNSSTRAWGSSGLGEVSPSAGSSVGRGLAGSCPAIVQGQKSPRLSALFSPGSSSDVCRWKQPCSGVLNHVRWRACVRACPCDISATHSLRAKLWCPPAQPQPRHQHGGLGAP